MIGHNNTFKLYPNILLTRDLRIICIPMEYSLAIKKKQIRSFTATWIDLEIIRLSEVSQTEKDIHHRIRLICGI